MKYTLYLYEMFTESYFTTKLRDLSSFFTTRVETVESPRTIEINVYLTGIFKVLSWNDPFLSWCSFLAINFLFWLAVQFELKLLGILFFVILLLFIYDNLFNDYGSSNASTGNSASEEVAQYIHIINNFKSTLCAMRRESPSAFCLIISVFFLVLSFIARNISGLLLMYLIILVLFFFPMMYKMLPSQVKERIKESMKFLAVFDGGVDEEDLIPLQNKNKTDDHGDGESLDTDRTAESITNSLISGISSMPSFLDNEDDQEILEEDLLPINTTSNRELTSGVIDLSSDSDSEFKEIHFKDSHFSKDTSSDEGSKFEDGLHFSEDSVDSSSLQHGTNRLVKNIVGYVAATSVKGFHLPGFVSDALSNVQGTNSNRENSSESDFELIDHDDAKH